jgi:hypothetical protein
MRGMRHVIKSHGPNKFIFKVMPRLKIAKKSAEPTTLCCLKCWMKSSTQIIEVNIPKFIEYSTSVLC